MNDDSAEGLRESLAAKQHEIWAHWMTHLFSVTIPNSDGSVTIPSDAVQRWQSQMKKDYRQLSESEKKSDREQVDKILECLEGFTGGE